MRDENVPKTRANDTRSIDKKKSNFVKKEILALGNIRNNNKHHLISVCVCVFLGVATLASGLK